MKSWKVVDKYNHTTIGEVALDNEEAAAQKLESALKTFSSFKKADAGKRREWLLLLKNVIKANKSELTELIIGEAGKPRGYAEVEIERSIATLDFAAEEARRLGGEVVPMNFAGGKGREAYTKRFPIGVILGISPFNFPLNLALHKIAPAIAAGNTILIKPSPFTPLILNRLVELAVAAGLPKGIFQVVNGDNDVSEFLVTHKDISLLSFTGSPQIGWMLKEKAGKKKVVLELGGNAGVLVDETSDLGRAARTIASGAFLYAGQICISTQRVVIVESVYEEFKKLLLEATQKLKVGDPRAEGVTVGPMISKEHFERVLGWIEEAKSKGASVLCGGTPVAEGHYVIAPTLIENTSEEDKVYCDEVFGPVAVLEKVKDYKRGLAALNSTRFGLQAGYFTERIDRLKLAFDEVEVGGLMINNVPGFRIDHMPYGGVKDSGLGREGLKYAIEDMTEGRLLVF